MTSSPTIAVSNGRRAHGPAVLTTLLNHPGLRKFERDGQSWYAAIDLVGLLTDAARPADAWADVLRVDPDLNRFVEPFETVDDAGGEVVDVLSLEGVLRLAQSVASPVARKLKAWLAQTGRKQLEEAADPAHALVDLQKQYARRGHADAWVQNRLRGMSARRSLVREWSSRGARESEDYRRLTNAFFEAANGMDVTRYRAFKGLHRTSENLRDHMSDLELTLTLLGETTAISLHRARGSVGVDELTSDVEDAGRIARTAREGIERDGRFAVMRGTAQDN